MLQKTRGIVLHHIKYSESSIIAYIYTEEFGRQSYMVNGIRGKNSSMRLNMFQPLVLLEMEVYQKSGRGLQRIKEIKNAAPYHSIPFDVLKSTISLFLAEIMYKSLQEEVANKQLFDFLFHSFLLLDTLDKNIANFHICFLIHLARFLGFPPQNNYNEENQYFDLFEGSFVSLIPPHSHFIDKSNSVFFNELLKQPFAQSTSILLSQDNRRSLLDGLVIYYQLHLISQREVKSLNVLKSVFE